MLRTGQVDALTGGLDGHLTCCEKQHQGKLLANYGQYVTTLSSPM